MHRAHLKMVKKDHRAALVDIDKAAAALPWSGWAACNQRRNLFGNAGRRIVYKGIFEGN